MLVPILTRAGRPRGGPGVDQATATTPPAQLHSPDDRLAETVGLAQAIAIDVVEATLVPVPTPKPATLFGSGKVEELEALVRSLDAELVIVDHQLTPIQQRNLERALHVKILDRTGLILEIFGARARTREGRLQVELAHLSYQKGRLVRAWTHLERQRGGAGFLGGPGEAQIELDRRMIQERINAIKKELAQVVRTRELHREGRRKVPYPIVAIVGYTNAGKSTLFNRLTGAGVLVQDQVFATLDPTMRELRLNGGRRIILSDTVGFISDLPTMLVAAFRATLEEVIEADLILHVRDISHHETEAQAHDVEKVLTSLGVDTSLSNVPLMEVWNKTDLLDDDAHEVAVLKAGRREIKPVFVSASTGQGMDALIAAVDDRLGVDDEIRALTLPGAEGSKLNWIYENTEVIKRQDSDDGNVMLTIRVGPERKGRLDALLAE